MITKIKGYEGSRRPFIFPADYLSGGMMTGRQRKTLTNLIFENFMDDERDELLAQVDGFSAEEAADMIYELTSKW